MGRSRRPHANFAIQSQRVNGFTRRKVEHDPSGYDGVDPFAAADLALTKRVVAKIETHYPSHPWMVKVSHEQGVVQISLPLVMPRNQVFVLHISALKTDPSLTSVMRACGEILERCQLPRHAFSLDHFLAARDAGPIGQQTRMARALRTHRIIMPS